MSATTGFITICRIDGKKRMYIVGDVEDYATAALAVKQQIPRARAILVLIPCGRPTTPPKEAA